MQWHAVLFTSITTDHMLSSDFNQPCHALQEPTTNGEIHKSPSKISKKPAGGVTSPIKSPVKTSAKPQTPDTAASAAQQEKKSEYYPHLYLQTKHEHKVLSVLNIYFIKLHQQMHVVLSRYYLLPSTVFIRFAGNCSFSHSSHQRHTRILP